MSMPEVLCIIVFIGALLGMLLFQCSVFMGVITAAAALGLFIVVHFILKSGKIKNILSIIFSAGLLCLCWLIPVSSGTYGTLDYQEQVGKLVDLQISGEKKDTNDQYEQITKKYGEDDYLLFVRTQSALDSGDLEEAYETVSSFANQHSQLYYTAYEQLIAEQYRTDEELADRLLDLYLNASKDNPRWWYPAKNAGGLLYDQGEYSEAIYYLTRAYTYDEHPDGETAYYLGSCFMELGNTEEGLPLLIQALDLGVNDTLESHISWYLQSLQNNNAEQEDEQYEEINS